MRVKRWRIDKALKDAGKPDALTAFLEHDMQEPVERSTEEGSP
jgi:hypothetical protein